MLIIERLIFFKKILESLSIKFMIIYAYTYAFLGINIIFKNFSSEILYLKPDNFMKAQFKFLFQRYYFEIIHLHVNI